MSIMLGFSFEIKILNYYSLICLTTTVKTTKLSSNIVEYRSSKCYISKRIIRTLLETIRRVLFNVTPLLELLKLGTSKLEVGYEKTYEDNKINEE